MRYEIAIGLLSAALCGAWLLRRQRLAPASAGLAPLPAARLAMAASRRRPF